MTDKNQIPSFSTSFVEAQRILTQRSDKPAEWLLGAYILFRSYETLLYEILASAKIEIENRWTLGKLTQEVLSQASFPSSFDQELREIVEHRNMVAHAHPSLDFTGEVFLDDLEKIRRLALWYLQDFPSGPHLSASASKALLKGGDFTPPEVVRIDTPPSAQGLSQTDIDRWLEGAEIIDLGEPKRDQTTMLPKVVFISYAREDQNDANNLYSALQRHGHKPWMDKRDLIAGQEWEFEIRKAIEKADFFVALMSSKSVTKRGFVQKEIRYALDILGEIPPGRIFFIPARLGPCDVPDIIKRLHWVDLQDDDEYLQIFRAIEHG